VANTHPEQPEALRIPDFSNSDTRERLSRSARRGFAAIVDKWALSSEQADQLLGKRPTETGVDTLSQDEITRISYVIGIYKALNILLPNHAADAWITRPNKNPLFGGQPPLSYLLKTGLFGLKQTRKLLDGAVQGH
jgi:hypothetical protein